MNKLTPPRLTGVLHQRAQEIRSNAIYYFLLEIGDQIEAAWGDSAQEVFQLFCEKLPTDSQWWLDRRVAAGMPNRPGKAVEAMKFNWTRWESQYQQRLEENIASIDPNDVGNIRK